MTIEKLYAITRGLNRRFPDGNDPFQMMTRCSRKAAIEAMRNGVELFHGHGYTHS